MDEESQFSQYSTRLSLIHISTALFNVGLTFLTGINRFYDQENDRLNGPHYQVRFYGNEYKEEYLEYFEQDARVAQAEAEDAILMDMCNLPQGGTLSISFRNMGTCLLYTSRCV